MTTRADVIADISHADNAVDVYFTSRATTKLSTQTLEDGRIKEIHGIPILILNQDSTTREVTQNIMVTYDENDTELDAKILSPRHKNASTVDPHQVLYDKFIALEASLGTDVKVKVDPKSLDTLGVPYFVFEVGGIGKVTATLAGVSLTRDTI